MNISLKAPFFALLIPLLCSSCGTTPASNYYVLSAGATEIPSGFTPSLGVGPVEIPEYLNRNAMVVNRDNNQLHIASFDRWAEPLDDSIRRVLRLNLASLLDTQDVQSYPWSKKETPQYAVDITIIGLDANDERARLVVEWHIRLAEDDKTLVRRVNELDYALPPGAVTARELAPAYSDLLLQLSHIIAREISENYAAGNAVTATQ